MGQSEFIRIKTIKNWDKMVQKGSKWVKTDEGIGPRGGGGPRGRGRPQGVANILPVCQGLDNSCLYANFKMTTLVFKAIFYNCSGNPDLKVLDLTPPAQG